MIGNTKPNFKTENSATSERRAKNEYNEKLYLSDLKRSLSESKSEPDPAPAFESIGDILAKRKMRRASSADYESHLR